MLVLVLLLALGAQVDGQSWHDLREGHWVRVKGQLDDHGGFVATSVEVLEPDDEESVVGVVTEVTSDKSRFVVLGLTMRVSARTEWKGITIDELEGRQVKVGGHRRGPRKFSARDVEARREQGRDRLEGRIDGIQRGGGELVLELLGLRVRVAQDAVLEVVGAIDGYALAPVSLGAIRRPERSDDDEVLGSVTLSDTLDLGGQLEWTTSRLENDDLDEDKRDDRLDQRFSVKGELIWEPTAEFFSVLSLKQEWSRRHDEEELIERDSDGTVSEAYGYFKNPFGGGVDVSVGRQDFDDPREWLYDENLDAVRLIWTAPGVQLELSASTVLADGGPRNRDTDNYMAYLSNNDRDRHLAAYVIDRRRTGDVRDFPLHAGVRALGSWFDDQEIWAEASVLRGHGERDYEGWAVDVGTTWSPPAAEPFYFTAGYAYGSGDKDPDDDVDTSFRQTGLEDNNGKFGGVTSFRYYGEVRDPQLSNLSIATAGVGVLLTPRTSLDLVGHLYRRAEDLPAAVGEPPDSRDVGWGADLILGSRDWQGWHLEVVTGYFEPGGATPGGDSAWLGKVQLRYRF